MYENTKEEIITAQAGDKEAMTMLLEENAGLIWNIVKRFSFRGYELDDLYQIGAMGLIKAIQRFDTSLEVQLSTYAVPYILGEIKRFLRDDGPVKVSRSLKELGVRIRELQKEHLIKQGTDIGMQELANELHTTKEEIALALDAMAPVESIYGEKNAGDDSGPSILESLSNKKDEAEITINRIALKELLEHLGKKEKELILLRYYKEKTQTQVAKILGISQVQVSRMEKKILNQMKKKLIS